MLGCGVERLIQIPDVMSGICEMILGIAPFLFDLDIIPSLLKL
jgi:hypothetical protein